MSALRLFVRAKLVEWRSQVMCPQGDVCDRCGYKAVVEIHWREWAMKLCPTCAPVLLR